MRGWKCGLWLLILPYWMPAAVAGSAVSGAAEVSEVAADSTPEEEFDAGIKSLREGDVQSATRLLKRAADRGHAEAQATYADITYEAGFHKSAVMYFRMAAEQGNADGQYGLSIMTRGGEGGVKQDYVETRKLLVLAAKQGHKNALYELTDAYISGGFGLDEAARNSPEALAWIQRAADTDYINAIEALAEGYRSGKYGLTADLKQAASLDAKVKKLRGISDRKKKTRAPT